MENFYFLEKALRSLRKNELKSFEKFLESPYCHKQHRRTFAVQKLYKFILAHKRRNLSLSEFDWEKYTIKIYPEAEGNHVLCKKLTNDLKSDLLSYFYEFIACENFNNDTVEFNLKILNELVKRNLSELFEHWCKLERFYKIDDLYDEPIVSFFFWKLIQIRNRYRESKELVDNTDSHTNSVRGGAYEDTINTIGPFSSDYDLEKMLLTIFFETEFKQLTGNTSPPRFIAFRERLLRN